MLTDVVGRVAAVAELRALLREHRLVTLTGPGGVGKARVALETATQSAGAFPDGVWLVELDAPGLSGTGSPADLVMTVLGIREDPSMDPADHLAEALRSTRMLLILNNCEHLIEQTAKLTARLLRTAPELRVLVTSREPLALASECVWPVSPLELPDRTASMEPAVVVEFSAVQLFVARTVAAYGLQRLRQAGEFGQLRLRHRRYYTDFAERAAPHLRGHDQRYRLRRLDVEAANLRSLLDSAIQDNDASAALRMVNALAWYWFLRGRLREARRALGGALALGRGSASARAMATAWQAGFTVLTGERGELAVGPLPLAGIDEPRMRATVEWFHGFVASDFGDPSAGEAMVGRALAGFRALGDRWGIAAALSTRAKQAMVRGDLAAVHRDTRQSLAIFREIGDRWGQLQAIEWLGAVETATGDYGQASRAFLSFLSLTLAWRGPRRR